jgi:RNA polymerase sigma-70 factor (ECF subfamily)
MSAETTRPSLLSRVRDPADHAAWAEFESLYRDLLLRYCRRCGLSAADAEDVRQMVFLRLIRVLPQFRYDPTVGRFHDWLYRLTRNAIFDFRRCPNPAGRAVQSEEDPVTAVDGEPADALWEQEWRDHHLRRAMTALRESCDERSVAVFERVMAGAAIDQVASDLGMSYDAVQKSVRRMRQRVEERIAAQIREEDRPDA